MSEQSNVKSLLDDKQKAIDTVLAQLEAETIQKRVPIVFEDTEAKSEDREEEDEWQGPQERLDVLLYDSINPSYVKSLDASYKPLGEKSQNTAE